MKILKFVKSDQENLDFDIDIYYEEVNQISHETSKIAASSIFDDEDTFYEFIENVFAILDVRGFNVVEHNRTNRDNSLSYYISFYPVDEDGNLLDRFMINFRISTHYAKSYKALIDDSRGYYNRIAKEHKPKGKKFQEYRIKQIIVGKKKFSTVDKALSEISKICDELMNSNYESLFKK